MQSKFWIDYCKREALQISIWTDIVDPDAFERDRPVRQVAQRHNVRVPMTNGHSLYDLDQVIDKDGCKPPITYTCLM